MNTKEKRRRPQAVSGKAPSGKRPVRKERKLRDSDVIYTPPKPFKRGRFLLHMATVVAVVLAMVFGMSIFFKVETVEVSGCEKYTPWEISEAANVEIGSNLMSISRPQISGNIISKLPYVNSVRVGINLPDTVKIEITEMEVVYAVEAADGIWWLMNSEGRIVEQTNAVTAKEYTQVLGVRIEAAAVGQQATAQEDQTTLITVDQPVSDGEDNADADATIPETTLPSPDAPTIAVGVTAAERLRAALSVLQQLSANSVSGQIDSVDVTDISTIELWYDERFQVNLGDLSQLEYKINALKATVEKMESYESGHLDLSFKNWADKVGYTPFT